MHWGGAGGGAVTLWGDSMGQLYGAVAFWLRAVGN